MATTALQRDGFEVVPGLLDEPTLERLRAYSEARLDAQESEHFERFRFHGSMLALDPVAEPLITDLVARPLEHLRGSGFAQPRWLSGYLISKPPLSPALWWHQDWWAWDDDVSFADFPPQLFVMYYLTDVDEHNGALRVIPGSHRRLHPLAHALPEAHSPEIEQAPVAHRAQPDEVTVAVRAGDAVVGDVRLLHATHPNRSRERRTCLTLWYLPAWERLPASIRAYVVNHPSLPPAGWWREADTRVPPPLRALLPRYDGSARPASYRRRPRAEGYEQRSRCEAEPLQT
jgi:hypothetical protein